MAAPGIVGVQPVPNQPGAYNAQLKNGQNMLLTGDAGESLYKRFLPSLGGAAAGIAGMVPGIGPSINGIRSVANALSGSDDMGAPPPAAPAPVAKGPATQASSETAPTPSQGAAPAAPQDQPSGPVPLGYTMSAVDPATGKEVQGNAMRMPDGTVGVYVPPRAGSPGGLTALGKGAVAASNKMEDQIATARGEEVAAREEGTMLAQEQAQREQAFYEEQKVQNMLAQQNQQDEQDAIASRVAERQARYDKLSEEARSGRVDENQYMRGAQGVFSALGMALGAAGAALARTPNFAADFVQSQIDRNIRRQEAELAAKGKNADNALGDLVREQGSLKDAKTTLKQLLTERTAIEANVMASTAKDQAIAARNREIAAQLAGQWAVQDKARRQGDLEHVMTSRVYYQPGSAGSTGGFLQPTQEGYEKGAAGQRANEELRIRQDKAARSATNPHVGQRGQAQINSAKIALGVMDEIAGIYGMKKGKDGLYQAPSASSVLAAHTPLSDTKQRLRATVLTFAGETGKAQTGGAPSDTEMSHLIDQFESARTPGQVQALLNHYIHTMQHVPEVVRQTAAESGPGSDEPYDAENRR